MREEPMSANGYWPSTAEEAIDAWKSLGDWQFADREAAWRWMFEQGRKAATAEMIAHCEERAKGWDAPKGKDHGDCEFGARHEARAIAAQLREMAGQVLTPNGEVRPRPVRAVEP